MPTKEKRKKTPASRARRKAAHGHSTRNVQIPKNHCFGCGKDNPDGMHLKFFLDEQKMQTSCSFKLGRRYQGPPGYAHGGVIAVILDEAMGKVNKFRNVIALTKTMEIEYMRPVPLFKRLTVVGFERSLDGRKHRNAAEIRDESGLLARGEGLFIAIDAEKMFPNRSGGPIIAPQSTAGQGTE
jgi:acyl-coenzyme A thioesterase PaaI-like protein